MKYSARRILFGLTVVGIEEKRKESDGYGVRLQLTYKLHLFSLYSESLSGCYGSQSMRMDRNQLRLNRCQLRLDRFQLHLDRFQLPLDFGVARANFIVAQLFILILKNITFVHLSWTVLGHTPDNPSYHLEAIPKPATVSARYEEEHKSGWSV